MRRSTVIMVIKRHPVLMFFALAFLINWGGIAMNVAGLFPAFGEYSFGYDGNEVALFRGRRTLLNWAPNIAAVIVLGISSGMAGVTRLFQKFFVWRAGLRWWLAVVFIPVMIGGLSVLFYQAAGGEMDFRYVKGLPVVFGMRFLFSLSLGSIGEEAGWRGFALPRMQKRFGFLPAALLLGVVWGLFHWPTLMIRQVPLQDVPYFLGSIMALSVLLAWVYHSTGSLLLVAVFHNTLNAVDVTLTYSFAAVVSRSNVMPVMTLVMAMTAVFVCFLTRSDRSCAE